MTDLARSLDHELDASLTPDELDVALRQVVGRLRQIQLAGGLLDGGYLLLRNLPDDHDWRGDLVAPLPRTSRPRRPELTDAQRQRGDDLVIAVCLQHPDLAVELLSGTKPELSPSDVDSPMHVSILKAMKSLVARPVPVPVNSLSVARELWSRGVNEGLNHADADTLLSAMARFDRMRRMSRDAGCAAALEHVSLVRLAQVVGQLPVPPESQTVDVSRILMNRMKYLREAVRVTRSYAVQVGAVPPRWERGAMPPAPAQRARHPHGGAGRAA